ncbi:MAG: FtsX-like permease family protein [Chloroflexi bacterium]|nr:FtsX-like permease family protein [Chloroflexota bacterium]
MTSSTNPPTTVGGPKQTTAPVDPLQGLRHITHGHWLFRPFRSLWDLCYLASKRVGYYFGLSLLALFGVILALGLVSSTAFFSQAVDTVMMRQELAAYTQASGRPPFSSLVFAPSTRSIPLTLDRAERLGDNVADTLSSEIGLPVSFLGLMADSGVLTLQPRPGDTKYAGQKTLHDANVVYLKGVADHIKVEGAKLDDGKSGAALDIWLHADFAAKLGVQIGEQFTLHGDGPQGEAVIPVQIRGFWRPTNAKESFWVSDPDQVLREKIFVRKQDYVTLVEPVLAIKVRAVTWSVVLNEQQARPSAARQYTEGFARAAGLIKRYVPDAQVTTPSVSLDKFIGRQTTLTTLLLGFNIPAFGFLLYFLILTSAVIAYWQRRETAVLISRGMTRWGVLSFTLIEGLILFVIALPLGLGLGMLLARAMGYTVSFLRFNTNTVRPSLPVSLDGISVPLVAITLGIILLAKLGMAALTTNQTILTQEREHARAPRGPFWYRFYLDLLLIIPTVYAYRQLAQRGTLGALVRDRPEDLYQDPLLIIVPALFIVMMALLTMRLFPLFMRLLDWFASVIPWLTPHLAFRQLARYSQNYINPLLLVIISLALGIYTLSLAASLDQWLIDRLYYRAGTDLSFEPYSEVEAMAPTPGAGADWIPPIDEFRALPGVASAARVGDYDAYVKLAAGNGNETKGRFLGVDRVDFSRTAWFRRDLARESLGGLMNRLAAQDDGILVSQAFLDNNQLTIGDKIPIQVLADFGSSVTTPFTIVGIYENFPTVYDDKVTVIGNLEYIFSFFGTTMPHRIWLSLKPGVDAKALLKTLPKTLGISTINIADTRNTITTEQAQMERVGVFGTLSVSFIAAALMAALGLLTYSYASLHERLFLFSVMRAIGLKRPEVLGQVALEYAILTIYGALAGVVSGATAAVLFAPLFRVTGEKGTPLPPLIPIVAQNEIIPLAIAFALIIIGLETIIIASALFQKLSNALRLGHQG